MILSMVFKMSLCADMCHRKILKNVCCDNDGYGATCAPETTNVCLNWAAAIGGTSCTMSTATQDCTNVLTAIPDATFQYSEFRNIDIEY